MSSTTQPSTFSDLYTELMNKVRADTSLAATVVQAKRAINVGLQDMHLGFSEKVPWAERSAIIRTQPKYTTGTVTATKGSATLTGASTAWSTVNDFGVANVRAGGKIKITGREVYVVDSVGGATTLTLETVFVGETDSALSYIYYEDEYALATDFLRPVDIQSFDNNQEIRLIGRTDFRRFFPRNAIPRRPLVATIGDRPFSGNATPVRIIRFAPPPDVAYQLPYAYISKNLAVTTAGVEQEYLSSDTDEPIVPLRYRHLIVKHGLKEWYRDKKNDPRAGAVAQEYVDGVARMASDTEIGSPRASMVPERASYRRAARRPWGSRGGRYDVNGKFDRMEE